MSSLADLLLTTDRHTRLRLSHSGLASLMMLGFVATLHVVVRAGMGDPTWLWPWTIASLTGMLLFFLLIRCGWTRRLADPSMTLPQMLYAILCSAPAYAIAGSAHGVVPLAVTVVLMFGMFGLRQRRMLLVAVYTMALFAVVIVWKTSHDPRFVPRQQLLIFVCFAIVLMAVVVLSGRLQGLTVKLRRQRAELEQAVARIHDLATRDDLTGLPNRRHLVDLLGDERERTMRTHRTWCLALIDLDRFKQVNDTHGHAVGDEVLRALAAVGVSVCRRADVLGRWGGEEFLMLLRDTELPAALAAVDRFRQRMRVTPVGAPRLSVSFSAGVAQHRIGEPIDQTLARADAALYDAKAQGRDAVQAEKFIAAQGVT